MVDRRSFLASVGTVAVAGCLSVPTSTEPPSSTDSPTAPASIDSSWPVPHHDPGLSKFAPDATGPTAAPGELWSVATDARLSAPVVADGTLYVGGEDGVVRALDARTGDEQWQVSVGAATRTPHAVGESVYVPTNEVIVALDADGTERWRIETPARRGLAVTADGLYYVSAEGEPTVVALDPSGTERWRTAIRDPWAPPVFAGSGQVFVTTRGSWDYPWRFGADTGEYLGDERPPEGGADFLVSECYFGGSVFAAKELFSTVAATPVTDGGYDWRNGVDDAACFELAAGTNHLYAHGKCIDRTGLFALSLADGSEVWYADAVSDIVGRPVVASDTVLVRDETTLYCFAPDDGTERWRRPAADLGERFVVVDDLLFTTTDGTVRALR